MPLVERRYAQALVNIAFENDLAASYERDFRGIVQLYEKNEEFRLFLLNPQLKKEDKKLMLKKLFSGEVQTGVLNFLLLLLDKGRVAALPGIFDEFILLWDKRNSILEMTIISAGPLDEEQVTNIKEKYKNIYKASSVKAEVKVDEGLIGGVQVFIGDQVVDASIKGRLEILRQMIVES